MYKIKKNSFSLIELIIVISIISFLFLFFNINLKTKNDNNSNKGFLKSILSIENEDSLFFYCKNYKNDNNKCFYIDNDKNEKEIKLNFKNIKEYFIDNQLILKEKTYPNNIVFTLLISPIKEFKKKIIQLDGDFYILDTLKQDMVYIENKDKIIEEYFNFEQKFSPQSSSII